MKAIITRNDQTAVLELPTSRMELAGYLSRIGIKTPAHIIPCSDEEEDYIKVKLFGESDFENELTALVTPKDSLVCFTSCYVRSLDFIILRSPKSSAVLR